LLDSLIGALLQGEVTCAKRGALPCKQDLSQPIASPLIVEAFWLAPVR
jgi:hypothetical protein